MNDQTFFIPRPILHSVFGGNDIVVRQFEDMQTRVADTDQAVTANVEATQRLEDAAFLTLSANAELDNERVLALADGLSFDLSEEGQATLKTTVYATSGHDVQFTTLGATALALPITGTLVTRTAQETLERKTLDQPSLANLGNYTDDAAANAGGVPIGGMYRNGSALQVRVA